MKIAPFLLFLLFISAIGGCKKNISTRKNVVYNNHHTLTQLHPYIDSLDHALTEWDTTTIARQYNFIYDSLDICTEDTAITVETKLAYYDLFFETLDHAIKSDSFLLRKKSRLLEYCIYVNTIFERADMVIKYFKILDTKQYEPFLPPTKRIDILLKVGVAYNKIGELAKTEQTYQETLQLAKHLDDKNKIAQAYINLNIFYQGRSLYDTIINNTLPLLNEDIDDKYKSKLAAGIANAFLKQKNYGAAIENIKLSEKYLLSIDTNNLPVDYDDRIGNVYESYANIYTAMNNHTAADTYYTKALNSFTLAYNNTGRQLGKIYLWMAQHKQQVPQSNLPQNELWYINNAFRCLDKSFDINDSIGSPSEEKLKAENLYIDALDDKTNYLLKQDWFLKMPNRFIVIDDLLKKASMVEKKLLNSFDFESAKIAFTEYSKERSALAVQLCYNAYTATNDATWINKAFQYIENNKATVLLERLKKNEILQKQLANDSLTIALKRIKQQIAQTDDKAILESLNERENELTQIVENKYPQLSNQNQFADDVSLNELQTNIKKKTGVLEYFYHADTLYCIYADKKQISFTKNTIAQQSILNFKDQCSNLSYQQAQPVNYFTSSHNLFKQLIPSNINSKINELIILPDDALNNLSFECLLTTPYQNINANNYVLNRYIVNYCYSYGAIVAQNSVDYADHNILACTPASASSLQGQEILPNTKAEALAIIKNHKKTFHYDNTSANSNNFLSSYHQYSIVHLATHAVSDSAAGNSLIYLYDQPINAQLLQQNNTLKTKLFFLSACETSLGKRSNSEGVLSLARSLYYAGAQNVIAAQWKINDASTAALVGTFYKQIKKEKYATALQTAKLNYLTNSNTEKKLPYYWASLIHIGYQKQYGNYNYYWYTLIGLVFFATLSVFLLKRKKENLEKLRKIHFFRKKK